MGGGGGLRLAIIGRGRREQRPIEPLVDNGLVMRWRGEARGGGGEGHGRGGGGVCDAGARGGGTTAARGVHTPAMDSSQVRRHIVLPVKLLMTDSAWIGLALQVCGDVVPVEVAGMRVCVVADLASVRVPILDAEAADGDWCGSVRRAGKDALGCGLGIEAGQLGLYLLLHLVAHQVRRGTGGRPGL